MNGVLGNVIFRLCWRVSSVLPADVSLVDGMDSSQSGSRKFH